MQGPAGGDRPRCGPHRAGGVAARTVPQDGRALLHREGEGEAGGGGAPQDGHGAGHHSREERGQARLLQGRGVDPGTQGKGDGGTGMGDWEGGSKC